MKRKVSIPIHSLQERGKKNFEIHRMTDDERITAVTSKAHRDDNYMLFYQESGVSVLVVDFQKVIISGAAIFCILPGQVHYGISLKDVNAWVIAADTDFIQDTFRPVLLEAAIRNSPVAIEEQQGELFRESLQLLLTFEDSVTAVSDQTVRYMLDVCLSLFVTAYQKNLRLLPQTNLRPALITKQFRNLLQVNFRTMKSPAKYAASLHISPSYLNEVVKETTGYPVSHWIHQEIILEAKRMLFYTNHTVKEIAFNLGYADVTYFIRLFSKVSGMPPLQFRYEYHKS